jgi:hypothetical protein
MRKWGNLRGRNTLAEIRLTPPRRARRRIAGFVIPWMLSRRIFRWRFAPPFPRPLPPLPPEREVSTRWKRVGMLTQWAKQQRRKTYVQSCWLIEKKKNVVKCVLAVAGQWRWCRGWMRCCWLMLLWYGKEELKILIWGLGCWWENLNHVALSSQDQARTAELVQARTFYELVWCGRSCLIRTNMLMWRDKEITAQNSTIPFSPTSLATFKQRSTRP